MMSQNQDFVLTYNGEIYNHLDLRTELAAQFPIRWRGHSDSETLLEALVHWGVVKTLELANGMFAFGLWNTKTRQLVLARDRFGEKPLYYALKSHGLLFASELKAFRGLPQISHAPDRTVVARYLANGTIPAPLSILGDVKKLPPGSYLEWNADQGAKITCYWMPETAYEAGLKNPIENMDEGLDEFEALLLDAVKIRKMSDVPLGAMLSGGVDSSLVTALMQKDQTTPVQTFSIGFEDSDVDESVYAEQVAKHLGTHHHKLTVTDATALATVPLLGDMYDEPFADASQIPTYLVSALTRKNVTVALTGDGFDELFAGYARYVLAEKAWRGISLLPGRKWLAARMEKMPAALITTASRALSPFIPAGVNPESLSRKLRHSGSLLSKDSAEAVYAGYMKVWENPEELMLRHNMAAAFTKVGPRGGKSLQDHFMLSDQYNYLPNDILAKVDRASMAVSLETRIPALDPRVAEFAWRFGQASRWQDGKGKWPLRQILYRYVPKEMIDRPKRGFTVPLASWLRGPLKQWAGDMLSVETLHRQDLLKPDKIQTLWQDFQAGGVTTASQIWTIVMLQAWLEAWGQ